MMRRPFKDKRPLGPFVSADDTPSRTFYFIDDHEAFGELIADAVKADGIAVTALREKGNSVDLRIDAVDKNRLMRVSE